MSPVANPTRRRQFTLGALTVLLHLIVFRWIVVHVGLPREEGEPARAEPPPTQLVDVRPEAPPPPPPPPPPRPRTVLPPPPPPPLPELDPETVDVAVPTPAPAAAVGRAVDGPGAGVPAAGTPAADGAAAPGAAAATAAAQPAPPPQQPQEGPRRYKIDLPPSADLKLDVVRVDADGSRWTGEETLTWKLGPDGYRIRIDAGLNVMFAHVNLLTLTSEGKLGDEGFVPTLMMEKRRGKSATATHFGRGDTNLLTFSASQARYGLQPYMQDRATLPLELAAIARGDAQQLSGKLEFIVGEDRDASVYTLTVVGQEDVETRMGRISALHLVRPPKPGSYSSRLDLWLAPDRGWYPVQIRNVEANGATTTQTVSSIVTK